MTLPDLLSAVFLVAGAFFFFAGSIGLLRFPDVFTRIHALSKADNVGLGFVVLGLSVETSSISTIAKLGIIWLLVLVSSSISSQLIANHALEGATRIEPWRRR
jgi:multicomponent Na+:H+ antiporter subunit G